MNLISNFGDDQTFVLVGKTSQWVTRLINSNFFSNFFFKSQKALIFPKSTNFSDVRNHQLKKIVFLFFQNFNIKLEHLSFLFVLVEVTSQWSTQFSFGATFTMHYRFCNFGDDTFCSFWGYSCFYDFDFFSKIFFENNSFFIEAKIPLK